MVSVLERSRFEPWLGTLCCVLGQDTLLSQCLSLPTEHDQLLVSNFQQQRKICFKYNVHAWLITESGMLVHVHYRISCQKLGQDASTIYHLYIFFYSDLIYSYHYNFVSSQIAFLDERGLRNPNCTVRSRCSYLFSRFIKSHKYVSLYFVIQQSKMYKIV